MFPRSSSSQELIVKSRAGFPKSAYLKIGNSRMVTLADGGVQIWKADRLRELIHWLKSYDSIYVLSVVPKIEKLIRGALKKKNLLVISRDLIPLRSQYAKTLGVDRLMNVYAAARLTSKDFVVIDFGTALTVDFYSAKRQLHLGGWILASPFLSARALHEFTAQLPWVEPKFGRRAFVSPSLQTQSALEAGHQVFLNGMMGEVEKTAARCLSSDFEIFITGGGAKFSAKPAKMYEHLGLLGLRKLIEQSGRHSKVRRSRA